jgi:hypothetical protein
VTDGQALGSHLADGAPAFISKSTGRGQALLLNLFLSSVLPNVATADASQYALMRRVLSAARVEPYARIESDAAEPETHCELNSFRDGGNQYLGVYAHSNPAGDPAHVRIRFPDSKETYDVRSGSYLGRVDSLPLPLKAAEAALFARLDYRVTGLTLTAAAAKRAEPVLVDIAIAATGPLGRHVVNVQVIRPDGKVDYFSTRNSTVTAGAGQLQFVPALNDPPGIWRIRARDVISGARAEIAVAIE